MKLRHRLQERLADRLSFVQYPNLRPANESTRAASRISAGFKTAMPIGERFDLLMLSLALLAAGLVGLVVTGFLIYVVASTLFK